MKAAFWRRLARGEQESERACLVDQWPLYASYFGLVGSRPARATFGPSSLHYSATSFSDRFVLPDLGAMRVQLALDALCPGSAWLPPCGLGGDNEEQAPT